MVWFFVFSRIRQSHSTTFICVGLYVVKEKNRLGMRLFAGFLAEAVRFELTKGCPLPVFKTGAFNHSATLPCRISPKEKFEGAHYITLQFVTPFKCFYGTLCLPG